LIDDSPPVLEELRAGVRQHLGTEEAEIRIWAPTKDELNPHAEFQARVDPETILVITDYDLTGKGRTGLFGASIVAWCQTRGIPVADYSREMKSELPKEPNLFELRAPKDTAKAAPFIAAVFRGFAWIRSQLSLALPEIAGGRSPAAVIATLLEQSSLESQFSLYGVRLGTTSAALVERIRSDDPTAQEKQTLLAYIIGHLLLNSILRFPGPILSEIALASYLAVASTEMEAIRGVFLDAAYVGPFAELDRHYWLAKVDDALRPLIDVVSPKLNTGPETHGELHRIALEQKLGRQLLRHSCDRCAGQNGGFWCPFTRRTVCLRSECSVGANSWIPQGARLCRIERVFYDEWAPIFGI
jgi:hypothetical protein